MPQLTLEMIAARMGPAEQQNAIKTQLAFIELHHVQFINALKREIAAIPPGDERISDKKLAEINVKVLKELDIISVHARTQAARNVCGALTAIASIKQSPELQKISQTADLCIKFAQKMNDIRGVMNAAEGIAALADPAQALTQIIGTLFNVFYGEATISTEQIMLKALQEISQQMNDLQNAMMEQFGQVHEHLAHIHESILNCIGQLQVVLSEQIGGFRNEVISKIEHVISAINQVRDQIQASSKTLLTKNLPILFNEVISLSDSPQSEDLTARVRNTSNELSAWVLYGSNADVVNGMTLYNPAIYGTELERSLLPISHKEQRNKLGCMAAVLNQICSNLQADQYVPIVPEKVVNPDLLGHSVPEYLRLRKTFPAEFRTDIDGATLSSMADHMQQTLTFFHNLQHKPEVFSQLLVAYETALDAVAIQISRQADAANALCRTEFKDPNFNLNANYPSLCQPYQNRLPPTMDIGFPKRRGDLYPVQLPTSVIPEESRDRMKLPAEVLLTSNLGITDLICKYDGDYKYKDDDDELNLGALFSNTAKNVDDHKVFVRMYVTVALANNQFVRKFQLQESINAQFFAEGSKTRRIRLMSDLFGNVSFMWCPVNTPQQDIDQLAYQIKDKILNMRRQRVVQPLLAHHNKNFDSEIQKLDLAKHRLLAFAILAGLDQGFIDRIRDLHDSKYVIGSLNTYMLETSQIAPHNIDALFNSPYWQRPQGLPFVALKDEIKHVVSGNIDGRYTAPILLELQRIQHSISAVRNLHLDFLACPPHLKTADMKCEEFGIKIHGFDDQFKDRVLFGSLLSGIMQNNIERITVAMAPAADRIRLLCEPIAIGSQNSVLHLAAYLGATGPLNLLIKYLSTTNNALPEEKAAILHMQSRTGLTALMYAELSGNTEACNLLKAADLALACDPVTAPSLRPM